MKVRGSFIGWMSVVVAVCGLNVRGERLSADDAPADALLLNLRGIDADVLLELRIEVAGSSISQLWDDTFRKMFAFYDRDRDGALSAVEQARLPTPYSVRQGLWNPFHFSAGKLNLPPMNRADSASASFGLDTLAAIYRRLGLGAVLVAYRQVPDAAALTDALLKQIDADRDGVTTEAEWTAAGKTLRACDANEDELISPGELVAGVIYPGAGNDRLLTSGDCQPEDGLANLPFVIPPCLDGDSANRWTATQWKVCLGDERGSAEPASEFRIRKSGLWKALHVERDTFSARIAPLRQRLTERFAELDENGDGVLAVRELFKPTGIDFATLSSLADADGDGNLTAAEFAAWLELRETIARGYVVVTILDHGPALYALLDDDRDGKLSLRELRDAWTKIDRAGCVCEDRFERSRLPRQFDGTISHGQPRSLLAQPERRGAAWFLAMDRNGDGDVSRREFLGLAELFRRLDADCDGLISALEADGGSSSAER